MAPIKTNPNGSEVDKLKMENKRLKEKLMQKSIIISTLREDLRASEGRLATSQKKLEKAQLRLQEEKTKVEGLETVIGEKTNSENHQLQSNTCKNETLQALVSRTEEKSRAKFSIFLKEFAIKLHFKSPNAYDFLRQELQVLPHPRSLQLWLSNVDTRPGFFPSVLDYLRKMSASSNKPLYFCIMIDEAHIRKGAQLIDGKMIGSTNYGGIVPEAEIKKDATSALFIMIVGMNNSIKCPMGYMLTNGLKADMIGPIFQKSLQTLHECGGIGKVITFDGLKANFKGVEKLGAKLDPLKDNFNPSFSHPNTSEKVYVFPDPPHMVKLVRNTLEHAKVFQSGPNKIKWDYFEKLVALQSEQGLHLGNKLTTRHVNFKLQKMKVKLAVQLLSLSVASSLRVLVDLQLEDSKDAGPTADFVETFDKLFDSLNSHCKGTGSKSPLHSWNRELWEKTFSDAENLILSLTLTDGTPLLKSDRSTGFKGLLICIRSLRMLMEELLSGQLDGMTFLTVYKLCQDHLEIFFSLLRGRLGYNNNPNVMQLESSLKRILTVSMQSVNNGNCINQDGKEYPQVCPLSSVKVKNTADGQHIGLKEKDLIENYPQLPTFHDLSLFVNNVVAYVAGFVGRKLVAKSKCTACASSLFRSDDEINIRSDFILLNEKNRGGLFIPSNELISVCKIVESVLRAEQSDAKSVYDLVLNNIVRKALRVIVNSDRFKDLRINSLHGPLSDHVFTLERSIVYEYTKLRLHHVARQHIIAKMPTTIRNYNSKLVLFKGQ